MTHPWMQSKITVSLQSIPGNIGHDTREHPGSSEPRCTGLRCPRSNDVVHLCAKITIYMRCLWKPRGAHRTRYQSPLPEVPRWRTRAEICIPVQPQQDTPGWGMSGHGGGGLPGSSQAHYPTPLPCAQAVCPNYGFVRSGATAAAYMHDPGGGRWWECLSFCISSLVSE